MITIPNERLRRPSIRRQASEAFAQADDIHQAIRDLGSSRAGLISLDFADVRRSCRAGPGHLGTGIAKAGIALASRRPRRSRVRCSRTPTCATPASSSTYRRSDYSALRSQRGLGDHLRRGAWKNSIIFGAVVDQRWKARSRSPSRPAPIACAISVAAARTAVSTPVDLSSYYGRAQNSNEGASRASSPTAAASWSRRPMVGSRASRCGPPTAGTCRSAVAADVPAFMRRTTTWRIEHWAVERWGAVSARSGRPAGPRGTESAAPPATQ